MQHPQPAAAPDPFGATTPDPEIHSASGPTGHLTMHEFLTRLVASPEARSAFEADPHGCLHQAGLGEMTPADVLHATSLALDYAPVEVVEAFHTSLRSTVEKFAASTQQIGVDGLHSAHPIAQEVTDTSMSMKPQPVPQPAPAPAPAPAKHDHHHHRDVHIEHDSHNFINIHDVLSHENVLSGNNVVVDPPAAGGVAGASAVASAVAGSGVSDTVNHVVDVANGLVHDIGGGLPSGSAVISQVESLASKADVTLDQPASLPVVGPVVSSISTAAAGGALPSVPGVGDVVSTVQAQAGALQAEASAAPVVGPVVSNVAAQATSLQADAGSLPVVGNVVDSVQAQASNLQDGSHGLAGGLPVGLPAGLPVGAEGVTAVAGTATSAVSDVAHSLPAPSSLPVVGTVTNALPTHAVTDNLGTVTDHVSSTVHEVPVVSTVVESVPAPAHLPVLGPVVGDVADTVHNVPVAGDAVSSLHLGL